MGQPAGALPGTTPVTCGQANSPSLVLTTLQSAYRTTCGQSILTGFTFLTLLDAGSFRLFQSILEWYVCHKYTSKRVLTDTCHNNDLVILLHRQGSFARCIILFIGHMCDGLINCHVVFFLSVLQFGFFLTKPQLSIFLTLICI